VAGVGTPWTSASGTVTVFNNVFISNQAMSGIVQLYKGTGFRVLNNTIVGPSPTTGLCLSLGDTTNAISKNNAISGCNQLNAFTTGVTVATPSTDLNYNAYANCTSFNCWTWSGVSQTANFPLWKTQCSCDANASTNASLLLNADGTQIAGSPTIDTGTDLSGLGITALNSDYLGNARGAGSGWDVGAYEFGAGEPPPPDAPTGHYIAAYRTNTCVVLVWPPVANATGYVVYRSFVSGTYGTPLATITVASAAASRSPMTQYIDSKLYTAGTWYYKIAVLDASDELSSLSTELSVTVTGKQ
jgi:hypothetical protein